MGHWFSNFHLLGLGQDLKHSIFSCAYDFEIEISIIRKGDQGRSQEREVTFYPGGLA